MSERMSEAGARSESRATADEPGGIGARRGVLAIVRRSQTLQTLLAAIVAWLASLAPIAYGRAATPLATVLATAAIIAGLAGPLLIERSPPLSRHVGISVYVALSVATWLASGPVVDSQRLDPLLGALGAASWGIFALAWSDRWNIPTPPDPPKSLASLPARATLPRTTLPIATFGVCAGLALLGLGWAIRDHDRALVGQAAALACAVAVITAGAAIAVGRGRSTYVSSGLSRSALRALALLVVLVVVGLVGLYTT